MLRKVLIGALMLTALLAAPAAAQYADFVITPGTVSVGGNATFQGSGCAPGSTVTITIDGKVMATVTADAGGDYNGAFKADLAAGTYTVTATCGNVVRTTPLTVRGVSVTPPAGTGGGSLPRTGSNTNTMALVGAGLLLLGGGAILATRKRTIA
jgi:LPXTG-motif cell wall-anchored protein